MSGGSYDYICYKIEDFAGNILTRNDPKRIAFAKLVRLVAEAAHDLEWVDSCDYAPGDEEKAIDKVLGFLTADPNIIAKAHAYDEFKKVVEQFLKLTNPTEEGEKNG